MAIEPVTDHDKPGAGDGKPAASGKRPPKRTPPNSAKLRGQLTELYVSIGTLVVTPVDRLAGALMVAQAEDLAQTWVDLADANPAVKKALQRLVEAGGWGGVVIAHGMLLMPVLANRGMFPDQAAGFAMAGTCLMHPEVTDLFTHPRFHGENGNGAQPHG